MYNNIWVDYLECEHDRKDADILPSVGIYPSHSYDA